MFPIKDTIPSQSFSLVNWLLIIANVAVFVVVQLPLGPAQLELLIQALGLTPVRLTAGEPWAVVTIFTSMFLHGGWVHLISNVWALYIFGDNVEDRMGSGRYLVFYLLCGSGAALAQTLVHPTSPIPMIGASGALAGVLGAYLISFPHSRVITFIPIYFIPWLIEVPAPFYLALWFFIQVFSGMMALGMPGAMGGIAYWAHIGGFVAGLVLVTLFARRRRRRARFF